jgi:hypothetical protein
VHKCHTTIQNLSELPLQVPVLNKPTDQLLHYIIQEPELDPDFDWIALAKRKKQEALEDNSIRFER